MQRIVFVPQPDLKIARLPVEESFLFRSVQSDEKKCPRVYGVCLT